MPTSKHTFSLHMSCIIQIFTQLQQTPPFQLHLVQPQKGNNRKFVNAPTLTLLQLYPCINLTCISYHSLCPQSAMTEKGLRKPSIHTRSFSSFSFMFQGQPKEKEIKEFTIHLFSSHIQPYTNREINKAIFRLLANIHIFN